VRTRVVARYLLSAIQGLYWAPLFPKPLYYRGVDCLMIQGLDKEKGTHDIIHYELITLFASQILGDVFRKFVIVVALLLYMCDECTDVSNKRLLTICLSWVDESLKDYENFVGLYQVNDITSDTLIASIKDFLSQVNIDLSICRASSMSGTRNGGATDISSR